MSEKPTVLIAHNYYQNPGGEDIVAANEKKLLEAHGHEVILYTRSNNEIKSMGALQKLLLPLITIFNVRTFIEIRQIIKSQKINIVHVHNTLPLISPAVYYAALSCKVPVVQTMHNFRLLCPNAMFYRNGHVCEDCVVSGLNCAVRHSCYRNSKLQTLLCVISMKIHRAAGIYGKINFICLSDFNRNKLLLLNQRKQIIDPDRVFIKPNFTFELENNCSADKGSYYIYAGRLEEQKGIKVLLDAWKTMGSSAPLLLICGSGPLEDLCKEASEKLNIRLMGFVPHKNIIKLFSESKALIFPSLGYEGFPLTIVEAFSVGTPAIGSDIGNIKELIENGKTGFRFTPGNVVDLIKAIKAIEKMNLNRDIIISNFLNKYCYDINYRVLEKIYQEIRCKKQHV